MKQATIGKVQLIVNGVVEIETKLASLIFIYEIFNFYKTMAQKMITPVEVVALGTGNKVTYYYKNDKVK